MHGDPDSEPGDASSDAGRTSKLKPKNRVIGLDVNWESVSLDDIDFNDRTFQYRLSFSTADLRTSLEKDGQEEPIDLLKGMKKPYRIIDGFRRSRAALELGWKTIKAFVHVMDDERALRFAYTKNVLRKSLTPMERAHALWVGMKMGLATTELAAAFRISERHIARLLRLLEFSPALQKCIDGKVMTMEHAKVLHDFGVDNPADWKDRIQKQKLDSKGLRKALRQIGSNRQPGRKRDYFLITHDRLRMYPWTVTKNTPREERDRIARLMIDVLKFLERGLE